MHPIMLSKAEVALRHPRRGGSNAYQSRF